MSFGLSPLLPVVVIRAARLSDLEKQVVAFRQYVSTLEKQAAKHVDLRMLYSRDDCRSATNAALFLATRDGIAKLGGKPFRYLEETTDETIGPVSCMYDPTMDDVWPNSTSIPIGAADASVTIGY